MNNWIDRIKDTEERDLLTGITFQHECTRRVAGNNLGAHDLVIRLQHRTKWYEMMQWLDRNGYHGEDLWILYKDFFRQNLFSMGDFILKMMDSKHYQEQYGDYRYADLKLFMPENLTF